MRGLLSKCTRLRVFLSVQRQSCRPCLTTALSSLTLREFSLIHTLFAHNGIRSRTAVYLCTRAPVPPMMASTSFLLAIVVSPGVVIASAPWAAPYSTASCASPVVIRP